MKTTKLKKALLLGVAVCLSAGNMFAQSLLWSARYTSSHAQIDYGNAVYVDGSNNVFVTGSVAGSLFIRKYNVSGTLQWTTTYNGAGSLNDEGRAITADGSGNLYVTGITDVGSSNYNIVIIKYNSSGTQQWANTYGPTGTWDYGNAIAWDATNSYLYVAGSQNDSATIIKLNSSGTLQWGKKYVGTGSMAYDLELDCSANPHICGIKLDGGSSVDAFTLKSNSGSVDESYCIKIDGSGNCYICGQAANGGNSQDGFLQKLNSSGTSQWISYAGGSNPDGFQSLALSNGCGASNPDIYVTGVDGIITHNQDILTCKYNNSGTQQWSDSYDGTGNNQIDSYDIGYMILYSANTNKVIVAGITEDSNNKYDIIAIRHNISTGAQDWSVIYNYSTANLYDQEYPIWYCMGLGYDDCHLTDYVFITGGSQASATNLDVITLLIGATGDCSGRYASESNISIIDNADNTIIYPNPFVSQSVLVVDSKIELYNASFIIYDLYGKIISEVNGITTHSINIERGDASDGIYFYRLIDGENIISTGKIIMVRE